MQMPAVNWVQKATGWKCRRTFSKGPGGAGVGLRVPWGLSFKGWVSRAKVLSTGKLTSQSELFIRHREEGGGGWEHFEEEGHGTRITKDQGTECVFGPVGSQ